MLRIVHSRKFATGSPGKRWLVLVLAPDLEQVVEVCRGGMDLNEVFMIFGRGIRQVGHLEVLRALSLPSVWLNGLRSMTMGWSMRGIDRPSPTP